MDESHHARASSSRGWRVHHEGGGEARPEVPFLAHTKRPRQHICGFPAPDGIHGCCIGYGWFPHPRPLPYLA
ncbi:unnamed protein product [Ectocarpus sp. 4 AP-2014]